MSRARPWGDYALRVLACVLLLGSGYALLANSTFALRLRDDVPGGSSGVAFALAAGLSFLPLAFGKRFLAAFLVSSFLLSGIGAYWWTSIPWDELIYEGDFVTHAPATVERYALVASPIVVAVLYVAASNASRLRASYRNRGADPEEVSVAACASFLAGMGALVLTLSLSAGFWWVLSTEAHLRAARGLPQGAVAVALAALVALVAVVAVARMPSDALVRALTRPWRAAAGLAARVRSRGQRSPS